VPTGWLEGSCDITLEAALLVYSRELYVMELSKELAGVDDVFGELGSVMLNCCGWAIELGLLKGT
jgi:hypothetical protein